MGYVETVQWMLRTRWRAARCPALFPFGTFLGGTNSDAVVDLALGPTGDVYVVGNTFSADFPTTPGAPDQTFGGDLSIFWGEAFVAKLAMGGSVTPPTQLPAPSLVSPATDARFTRGQPIAFDWSDVAGAAGYTIQIDDSSTFSAPLTLRRNLTPSAFTTSTLPATTLWWRVRAKDSAGAAGKWSVTRRFAITN
jgi:hypothetical protein